jgi:hypothetical protein
MTVEITTINYTVPAETYAEYGADFDTEAVDDAVLAELNARIPSGITVQRNGVVVAEDDAADTARELDWNELLGSIDVVQLLAVHGRRTR